MPTAWPETTDTFEVDIDRPPEEVPGHIDEPHARLDEPPADQRTIAEQRAAVAVELLGVFLREIKGGPQFRRGEYVEGPLLRVAVAGQGQLPFAAATLGVNLLQDAAPAAQSVDLLASRMSCARG